MTIKITVIPNIEVTPDEKVRIMYGILSHLHTKGLSQLHGLWGEDGSLDVYIDCAFAGMESIKHAEDYNARFFLDNTAAVSSVVICAFVPTNAGTTSLLALEKALFSFDASLSDEKKDYLKAQCDIAKEKVLRAVKPMLMNWVASNPDEPRASLLSHNIEHFDVERDFPDLPWDRSIESTFRRLYAEYEERVVSLARSLRTMSIEEVERNRYSPRELASIAVPEPNFITLDEESKETSSVSFKFQLGHSTSRRPNIYDEIMGLSRALKRHIGPRFRFESVHVMTPRDVLGGIPVFEIQHKGLSLRAEQSPELLTAVQRALHDSEFGTDCTFTGLTICHYPEANSAAEEDTNSSDNASRIISFKDAVHAYYSYRNIRQGKQFKLHPRAEGKPIFFVGLGRGDSHEREANSMVEFLNERGFYSVVSRTPSKGVYSVIAYLHKEMTPSLSESKRLLATHGS